MTHDEMIAVIQAHKEGKAIECRFITDDGCSWQIADGPVWNFAMFEYRVKPEPAVIYAVLDSQDRVMVWYYYWQAAQAWINRRGSSMYSIRRFIEDTNWKPE